MKNHGRVDVLSQKLPGGTEEIHEHARKADIRD
jgi:hypothetical protein